MLKSVISIALLFGIVSSLSAIESQPTASGTRGTFQEGGNNWRGIRVQASTNVVVLISSAPSKAGMGIEEWRHREIVNVSNGGLALYPSSVAPYNVYSATLSVHLASAPDNTTNGDSWVVPHQGPVWGIWSPGTSSTTLLYGGAAGVETWYKREDSR